MTTSPLLAPTAAATAATVFGLALLQGCQELGGLVMEDTASIDASTVQTLFVRTDAGDLDLLGDSDASTITAEAQLWCAPMVDHDEARAALTLELHDRDNGSAQLVAEVALEGCWVNVGVVAPDSLGLDVQDGAGNLDLRQFTAGVTLVDGNGNARLEELVGAVNITDGSGNLTVARVAGGVRITDGSGDLDVEDIDGDVDIDDGSGNLSVLHVTGAVTVRDGSGDIAIEDVGSFELTADGSGNVRID